MLLPGRAVISRWQILGLDRSRDLESKLIWSRFLSEATAHAQEIRARAEECKVAHDRPALPENRGFRSIPENAVVVTIAALNTRRERVFEPRLWL